MKFPTTGGSYSRESGKLTQVEEPTKPAPGPGEDLAPAPEALAPEAPAVPKAASPDKTKGAK